MGATDFPESAQPSPVEPRGRTLPCATCGNPVDPLRAARVAIFRERFRYFCSAECRARYDPDASGTPLPVPRRRGTPVSSPTLASEHFPTPLPDTQSAQRHQTAEALARVASDASVDLGSRRERLLDEEPVERLPRDRRPTALDEGAPPPDVGAVLLALSMVGGSLAVLLVLAGGSTVALSARVIVAAVACAALIAEYVMGHHDASELHPAAMLAAPGVATATAIVARLIDDSRASAAVSLSGLILLTTATSIWLMQRARRPLDAERERLAAALDQSGHRIALDETAPVRAVDLRPGEEIVIESGETAPADATITAGSATVLPWYGASVQTTRAEGDPIVGGARVVRDRLRAVVGWAGHDRAFMRLTNDPRRRADLFAPLARFGRMVAERGAPLAAGIVGLTAFAANQDLLGIVMLATAAQAAFANAGIAQIGALHVMRSVLAALRRGIVFRTADALDRAGRVSTAAFCARGTLLLGEPELTNIEPVGPHEAERVLALVAGAEGGAMHPVATAVLRAARARGVRPDGVRSPSVQPGLGVTAIASNGQPVVVGNRALMLKEKISVALAESKITELEAMGRTVLLVALGGRLVGVVGLQDGLRPGARASVQYLLDVGVEPVLLSGDARETCEALGRALDIEHIRPELLPAERGDEIRRLADGGAVVAVIGRSPGDDASLAAADVSVALASAGSSVAEWSVQLAADDVRDAAWAIHIAHQCRSETRIALTLAIAPAVAGSLAVAFAFATPALAAIAALAGTLAALLKFRANEP